MVSMDASMNISDVEARQLILGTVYASTREDRKHVDLKKLSDALQLDDKVFEKELRILVAKKYIDLDEGRVSLTDEGETIIDARIMSYCPHL